MGESIKTLCGFRVNSPVEQQSANSMSRIGLALGIAGLVAGTIGAVCYILIQVLAGAAAAASSAEECAPAFLLVDLNS